MGGSEAFAQAVSRHGVLLAAHGPYTAEGVRAVTGLRVGAVSRSFSTFDGLVEALEDHFSSASSSGKAGALPGVAEPVSAPAVA
jgi:hypothetical protein